jgi:cation diffusion facilitator family transporter
MKDLDISQWQHSHSFGQDIKKEGEKRTLIVIAITAIMMVIEVVSGILFGSMALLADGIHMGSHTVALGISAFAYIYARRNAHNTSFSFGTGKVNSLGGYTGAILLAIFALAMAWESIWRLIEPREIAFSQAIVVAIVGLFVNGVSVIILGHDHDHEHSHGHHHHHGNEHNHHHDHNLRSAYLHVMADALTSITAIFALLAAKYFGWIWMDPLMGIIGSILVAKWSLGLIKQTSNILLDKQDSHEAKEIAELLEDDGETRITDLHVWSIGPGIFGVIVTLLTKTPQKADYYRSKLNSHEFPHVSIEIIKLDE